MAISFDGANTLITLDSGVTSVDVADIYSEWKRWVVQGTNSKYRPAFRTIGGDPLSAIINAGAYYFLRNDFGWRVKPPEENITIYLTGNLAVEDTALPAFNSTDGAFTAAVLGLQPVTQGVTPEMKEQLEYASFQNHVTIDAANGAPGTAYPIGTLEFPVNNLTDALAIANERGFNEIKIRGSFVFAPTDVVDNFIFIGQSATKTTVILTDAATITNCVFRNMTITGMLDGGNDVTHCVIGALNYIDGVLEDCFLTAGPITLSGDQASILRCGSSVAVDGASPVIDLGGGMTKLVIRDYHGDIQLKNSGANGSSTSIDMSSGEVRLESTITSGSYHMRGIGKLVDADTGERIKSGNWNGATINNELLDSMDLITARKSHTNKSTIVVNGNGTKTVTVYDDDGATILYAFTVSADDLTRNPN